MEQQHHMLFETKQGNFWFLSAEKLQEVRENKIEHLQLMHNLKSVLYARVENVDNRLFLELSGKEDKVKEIMENWLFIEEEIQEDYHPTGAQHIDNFNPNFN